MPEILSFDNENPNDLRQNPLKTLWEKLSSLDRFTKAIFITSILFIIFAAAISKTLLETRQRAQQGPVTVAQADPDKVKGLTMRLFGLQTAYNAASGSASARALEVLNQLILLSSERKDSMRELIKEKPEEALKIALPKNLKDRLPQALAVNVEDEVTVTGTLRHAHSDDFERDISKHFYYLETDEGRRLTLHFTDSEADGIKELLGGTKAKIKGVKLDDEVAIDNNSTENFQLLSQPTNVLGASTIKKVAVITFYWQNDTRTLSLSDLRGAYFTNGSSVRSFYTENSFGKLDITGKVRTDGDVFGPYKIPYDNTNCASNFQKWGDAAKAKAISAGVDLSGYNFISYVFPTVNCGAGGWGSYGSWTSDGSATSWLNGLSTPAIAHELGHNLDADHASSLSCTSNGANVAISADSNCTKSEYGDPYDVMGKTYNYRQMSNYHKGKRLNNWLDPVNTLTIDRSTALSQSYTIRPIEKASTGVQSLRIPRRKASYKNASGTVIYYTEYYYLEYRQPSVFDNFASTAPAVNGIMIRLAPDYSLTLSSKLLDTTPSSSNGFIDAPLPVTKTFRDVDNGISITLLSVSPDGAQVNVKFDGSVICTSGIPIASISPLSQWAAPGETKTYALKISNTDGVECGSSTFNIAPTLPAGFTQSGPSTVTVSPGATATVNISITSPSALPTNVIYYTFAETITNANHTSLMVTANYNIQFPVTVTSTPTITPRFTSTPTITPAPDLTPPTVRITNPSNGAIFDKGSLKVSADASDRNGIASIKLYLDGNLVKTCNDSSCSDNTPLNSLATGTHTIRAVATDRSTRSNYAATSVTITKQ